MQIILTLSRETSPPPKIDLDAVLDCEHGQTLNP